MFHKQCHKYFGIRGEKKNEAFLLSSLLPIGSKLNGFFLKDILRITTSSKIFKWKVSIYLLHLWNTSKMPKKNPE